MKPGITALIKKASKFIVIDKLPVLGSCTLATTYERHTVIIELIRHLIDIREGRIPPKSGVPMPDFLDYLKECERAMFDDMSRIEQPDDYHDGYHLDSVKIPPAVSKTAYGYVYFIQSQTDWRIKIGFSRDIAERMKALAQECKLVGVLHAVTITETGEQGDFKYLRRDREWFFPGPELVTYIQTMEPLPHDS